MYLYLWIIYYLFLLIIIRYYSIGFFQLYITFMLSSIMFLLCKTMCFLIIVITFLKTLFQYKQFIRFSSIDIFVYQSNFFFVFVYSLYISVKYVYKIICSLFILHMIYCIFHYWIFVIQTFLYIKNNWIEKLFSKRKKKLKQLVPISFVWSSAL